MLRCLNCGLRVQRIQRHLVTTLPQESLIILSIWLRIELNPPMEDVLCHACYVSIQNADVNTPRTLGHTNVCAGCGRSLNETRLHFLEENGPLYEYIPWIRSIQNGRDSYAVCHNCWRRASRKAAKDSEHEMATPQLPTEPAPAPPPACALLPDHRSVESAPIYLPHYKRAASKSRHCIYADCDATQHDVQMTMKVEQANEQRLLEIEPPKRTRDRATKEEGTMRLTYIQPEEEKIPQVCPKCYSELPDSFLATQTQHKQVRSIIAKVYHFLEREYEQLKSLHPETDWSPLSRVRQRAAVATGVSEPDVLDILSEEADTHAADEHPPRKRPRTDHQSEYDDVNEAEQIEEALHEPDVYVATKPTLEPNPLEDSEDEKIIIKEEQDDHITYYTVMEAVSAPEETEYQSRVCIPKPEPPDVPHSLDINYSVNSSAVEACRDDIVRRDQQTTISQPVPRVHTQDSMLLQVKQEDITIEEEGIS